MYMLRAAINPRQHADLYVKITRSFGPLPINDAANRVQDTVGREEVYTKVSELRGMVDGITDMMTHSEDDTKLSLQNQKEKLECLICGYIRSQIECKMKPDIPYSLKCLCMRWYGNICMISSILNIDNINRIGGALKKSMRHGVDFFCGQKIYYSRLQTLSTKRFTGAYRYRPGTMIVIESTQKDIFVVFRSSNTNEICALIETSCNTSPLVHVAAEDTKEVCSVYRPGVFAPHMKDDDELLRVNTGTLKRKHTPQYNIKSFEIFQF